MAPDGSTVFVTGYSIGSTSGYDYATVAYDAASGDRRWVSRYNAAGSSVDVATSLAVRPDGTSVFVTGYSPTAATGYDYTTFAYDAATGDERWMARYDGPPGYGDKAHALQVSPDGSKVFVTGFSGTSIGPQADYATVAYDAATGDQLWATSYNGPGDSTDKARSIAVSPEGASLFVTGFSVGTIGSDDYATIA